MGSSAYYFTNENLKYIHGSMDSTATSLKSVYTTILKDSKGHDELDAIYEKNCDKTNFPQEMNDALKRYEKQENI